MNGSRSLATLRMLVIVILGVISVSDAMAQDKGMDLKNLQNYRIAVMNAINAHMEAIKDIVEGKVPFWHHVPDHAVAITGTSRAMLEIYPDKKSETGATPKTPSPLQEAAFRFNGEAARLVEISPSGNHDAITAQYKALGQAYEGLSKAIGAQAAEAAKEKTTPEAAKDKTTPKPSDKN